MSIADNPADEAAMLRKGELISKRLTELYPVAPEGFLDHSDPFTLLVAVLLSAQSLDKKVNAVTPALFRAAPTPGAMRRLGETAIREHIREVGLSPQKAANLFRLSGILETQHDGRVPETFAELEALPGVGHKTASVVMMQAFGHPAFPVDTHIHRLACRWGCGDPKSVDRTEAALKRWFPDPKSWAELHVRIILFGREHCPARKHDMDKCPVCSFAATNEARTANAASPLKFVGAAKHALPFSIREEAFDSFKLSQNKGKDDDEDFKPPGKKRKRATATKTGTASKKKSRSTKTKAQPEKLEDGKDDDDANASIKADKREPAPAARKSSRPRKALKGKTEGMNGTNDESQNEILPKTRKSSRSRKQKTPSEGAEEAGSEKQVSEKVVVPTTRKSSRARKPRHPRGYIDESEDEHELSLLDPVPRTAQVDSEPRGPQAQDLGARDGVIQRETDHATRKSSRPRKLRTAPSTGVEESKADTKANEQAPAPTATRKSSRPRKPKPPGG